MEKKELGQYFTKNVILKEKVYEFILNNPDNILEPSIGRGDLIEYNKNENITFDMYEIDKSIKLLDCINKKDVNYKDFLKSKIKKKYKTIIGNPPYVKTSKGNLYIDFIEKCYNLLEEDGELIFIVPSLFLKLTSSLKLLNNMLENGTFTHIFHPNDEKLFEDASIDIIIFRYCKNINLEKKVLYNDKLMFISNNNGIININENNLISNETFSDYFNIYVGIVSGKDDVYKNDKLGNIEVITGENKREKYIYISKYPCEDIYINEYLLQHKEILMNRKIRKFNDKNWFEWGALRNIKKINENINKECIYLHNLTRKTNVAFIDKVNYFGGGLIILIPKKQINLINIVNYLNSNEFKKNYMFSGRFKISHKQISLSSFNLMS